MTGNPKAGRLRTFECPSCGGTIGLRAVGISITATCQHCGSVIDVANENFRVIGKSHENTRNILLPIGTRGTLFGIEWEVIGFVSRMDDSEMYYWREYLLFNPYQGFRFLVENQGHWSFVRMLRQKVYEHKMANSVWLDNREYQVFLRGGAKVEYVLGEFYWRVKVGERTRVADYISPPFMLSMEDNDEEITWSQGIYVERKRIEEAFANDVRNRFKQAFDLPYPSGIAPNQPSPATGRVKNVVWTAGFFIALLIVFQIIAGFLAAETVVYDRTMFTNAYHKGKVLTSEPFILHGDKENVWVELYSPVQNNWLEVSMSLVNENSNDSYNFLQGVEYYYGRDSDGSWSEGSQRSSTIISSVPGGTYRLLMEPDAGAYVYYGAHADYKVVIKRDVLNWSNFWTAFFLILLYPMTIGVRHWSFETNRWSESDLAPAIYNRNY